MGTTIFPVCYSCRNKAVLKEVTRVFRQRFKPIDGDWDV